MKNIFKTSRIFALGIMLLYLASCDRLVEVELPDSQLTNAAVFENMTTANAAMVGIYANMRNTGMFNGHSNGISTNLGLYADEFDYYGQTYPNNFYTNTLIAAEPGVADIWNHTYNHLYAANAIIEGTAASATLPETGRRQLRGECLFIRALLHLNLVNLFGDIPYVTTTNYAKNKVVSRMSESSVYEALITDLKEASELLPEAYVSAERVRPNRSAAFAVLARAYLYHKEYGNALSAASKVINNPLYVWENDLDKVFLKESTTTIWQFMPNSPGEPTAEAELYILTYRPSLIALTPELIGAFETGDRRKSSWTGSFTEGTETWYYAFKYKQQTLNGSSTEYSIILRLAEQYLIRAEARLMLGDLAGAKDDLNLIRHTAGLNDTPAATTEALLTEILRQRRFELFTEFGQRFFDLKRTDRLESELKTKKAGWTTKDRLFPIPEKELLVNPNLNPQNTGY
jgi:hypothetical protein